MVYHAYCIYWNTKPYVKWLFFYWKFQIHYFCSLSHPKLIKLIEFEKQPGVFVLVVRPVNRKCYFLLRSTLNIYDSKQHVKCSRCLIWQWSSCKVANNMRMQPSRIEVEISLFLHIFSVRDGLWAMSRFQKMWIHFVSFLVYVWLFVSSAVHFNMVYAESNNVCKWRDQWVFFPRN